MSARVLLYAQNLSLANPTGIHRYCIGLATGLRDASRPHLDIEMWTGRWSEQEHDLGIPVRQLPVHRRLAHLSWSAFGAPRMERLTGTADLVHQLLPAFALPTKAPLVATIHDLLPLHHPEWYQPRERWGFRRAMARIQRSAARIIVLSEWIARDLTATLSIPRERISVVPGGIDAGFATTPTAATIEAACRRAGVQPGRFVLAIGAVEPRKNLITLIQAIAQVSPDTRLMLVVVGGDGHDAAEVHAAPARLGVENDVRFLGRVADDELRALLGSALVLAHPSWYEGFGFPPLEAMAAGVPVVASNAGSLPDVVGDAGLLLSPSDPAAWAEALARLEQDDSLRADLTRAGRHRATALTWQETARGTLRVYDEVLNGVRPASSR